MKRYLVLAALLGLAACANGSNVQTSSGAAYAAARPEFDPRKGAKIDQAVALAARVEPILHFPARIGLARIDGYRNLTTVPADEADLWIAFAKAHADLGTFEALSSLILEAAQAYGGDVARTTLDRIRLGAARQHLDAVLVYEVEEATKDRSTPLSVFNVTIVGAYLVPSHSIRGTAVASALLLDVRNGYPYGTAVATGRETGFVPSIGSEDRTRALTEGATLAAVANLVPEVDAMVRRLRAELDQVRAAPRVRTPTEPLRPGRRG